jgi:O-antigen/teichoic acid export membrane protein
MASAFVLLPFYMEGLSLPLFGKLSIFLSFSLLIQILVAYSFDSSVYVHYHEFKNDKAKLSVFISSAFILMLLIAVGVGIFFSIMGELLFGFVLSKKNISFFPYGVASVVTGIGQALFKVYTSLLQTREKPVSFLFSNLILFSLVLTLTIIGLKLYPDTLVGPIGGRLAAFVLLAGIALFNIFREFGIRFDFSWLRGSFGFNNYTFIYQLEQWFINYFDRIVMSIYLPLPAVGIYDFALRCLVVIEVVMNGLHNSFYPRVVSTMVENKHTTSVPEINRYYHGLIGIVMIFVVVCIIAFPVALDWFASDSTYREASKFIPYLAALYLPRVVKIFFSAPYAVLKYTKPLPFIYFGVSVIKIGVMFILIKPYGIAGVIIAGALAAIAEIFLVKRGLKGRFMFRFNRFKVLIAPAVLFLIIWGAEGTLLPDFPFLRYGAYLLVCGLILWMLYKNELLALFLSLRKRMNS